MVLGTDVSFYQDDPNTTRAIDFSKMKAAGAVFTIIRLGQNNWPDVEFPVSWPAAKAAGLARGSYWFYDSRRPPREQAEMAANMLQADPGELPFFLDLEEAFGGQYAGASQWRAFILRFQELLPNVEVGIYTAPYYWNENCPVDYRSYFAQFPLWIAHYEVNEPFIPDDWTKTTCWFWQYTNKGPGVDYGVETNAIDLDYFMGTQEEFDKMFLSGSGNGNGENVNKTTYTNGATKEVWTQFGHQIHAMVIPATAIQFGAFYYSQGVGHYAKDLVNNPYKVFFNFSPHDDVHLIVDELGLKIDPTVHHAYHQFEPWLTWSTGVAIIGHKEKEWNQYSTIAQGFRYVFENGVKTPTADGNVEWQKPYAQNIVANDTDNSTIIISTTGEPGGPTLNDMSLILGHWVEDGHGTAPIHYALQGDSGHSVQIAYVEDGELKEFVGQQENPLPNAVPAFGFLRLIEPLVAEGETPPPPDDGLPPLDVFINIKLGDGVNYKEKEISIGETLEPVDG